MPRPHPRATCFRMKDARLALAWGLLVMGLAVAVEPPAGHNSGWVDARVRALQPTGAEKRFDEIGWARDIRDAERLAKQHHRPVFLFTHLGRINTGRC